MLCKRNTLLAWLCPCPSPPLPAKPPDAPRASHPERTEKEDSLLHRKFPRRGGQKETQPQNQETSSGNLTDNKTLHLIQIKPGAQPQMLLSWRKAFRANAGRLLTFPPTLLHSPGVPYLPASAPAAAHCCLPLLPADSSPRSRRTSPAVRQAACWSLLAAWAQAGPLHSCL